MEKFGLHLLKPFALFLCDLGLHKVGPGILVSYVISSVLILHYENTG